MAKLTGPLFSLAASQKLGNTLVYFAWKGLNVARTYVIPTNPKTAPQTTQRGYLSDAVAAIHAAQALGANPLAAADVSAYALLGSTFPSPRTWFNQVCKQWIDQNVAALKGCIYRDGGTTPGANQLAVTIDTSPQGVNAVTAGDFYYGTSKTALIYTEAAAVVAGVATATILGLTTGVKYFWKFKPSAHADFVGTESGIYYGTPT